MSRSATAARFADRPAIESSCSETLWAGVPVVAAVAPLGARVLALTGTRASLQVWAVAVVGTTRLVRHDVAPLTKTQQPGWEQINGAGRLEAVGL